MTTKRVLVLPGDGIGKEVCDAAIPVLTALRLPLVLEYGEIGWECWRKKGNAVPDETWQQIGRADAVLLGAITSKPKQQAEAELPLELQGRAHKYVSPVIQLRQRLGLFANVRPSYFVRGDGKPYRLSVIRENTEGLYAGYDYRGIPPEMRGLVTHPNLQKYGPEEAAVTVRLQTKLGLERLFEFAFRHAVEQGLESVTFADKPNVMRESGHFAKEIFSAAADRFPEIRCDIQNVDAVALWLTTRPEKFGVIVAENMFGDILSDLAGGIMGGLGVAPSGNYGTEVAYFEPVHGSAPGMAGKNKANPSAMFLSIALMLEYLGYSAEAKRVRAAVATVIRKGHNPTYDYNGSATTVAFAKDVIDAVNGRRYRNNGAIISVGDELLRGAYPDTNACEIGASLHAAGYDVTDHAVCSNKRSSVSRALTRALGEHDMVVVSGGLGSTAKGVTRFAVEDALGVPLVFEQRAWDNVTARLARCGIEASEEDKQQALIPEGAALLDNAVGTACGFSISHSGTHFIVLPGLPAEMRAGLHTALNASGAEGPRGTLYTWTLLGMTEGDIHTTAGKISAELAPLVTYLWSSPYAHVSLRVDEEAAEVEGFVAQLDADLAPYTVSTSRMSAVQQLGDKPNVCWRSDDETLQAQLSELPGRPDGDVFVVNTAPALSDVLRQGLDLGTLKITCQTPDGSSYQMSAPLRGPEASEYAKDFSCFCYARSGQQAPGELDAD